MATDNSQLFTLIPYKDSFQLFTGAKKAYLYKCDKKICLLSGDESPSSFNEFKQVLKSKRFVDHVVFHAFYELEQMFTDNTKERNHDCELGLFIEYDDVKEIRELGPLKGEVSVSWQDIDFESYERSFHLGKEHLKRGDCYQYNLTRNVKGKLNGRSIDLLRKVWSKKESRGAYGSFTFSSVLKKTFLSNSPECLFQIDKNIIETMPIKGTIKDNGDSSVKNTLLNSVKNESELNMITDLLHHDLNLFSAHKAYVEDKKAILKVPGLYHTYSLLRAPYRSESLFEILNALFPGGSITGAPKKRVKDIIKTIEPERRGFYCGSTVIISKKLFAASINIRSLTINEDNHEVSYGAGGGVTFASNLKDEFDELLAKKKSFSDLLL